MDNNNSIIKTQTKINKVTIHFYRIAQDAAKVIKKKDQNSNIFNAEPNVQGDYKGKGYGDFYNMDKKQ